MKLINLVTNIFEMRVKFAFYSITTDFFYHRRDSPKFEDLSKELGRRLSEMIIEEFASEEESANELTVPKKPFSKSASESR